MLGTAPCLVSPVVLFELIHRRAAGNAGLRVRGARLRDREHAVHIHGCAMRAWNCLNGNATDIMLVSRGGVSDESVSSKVGGPRRFSPLIGFAVFLRTFGS
jgi:hypothetical protein